MTSINSKDPLREIRVKTEDLDLEGIQQSLVKVTDKEVSWRGRAWKEIKESVNTLLRSVAAFRFISHEKYINDKFEKNLDWLDKTVNSLSQTLNKNMGSLKTQSENYTANKIVKDRVDKVDQLLSKIKKTKGINEKNSKAINDIITDLKKVSNFCSDNLQASAALMDKKIQKDLVIDNHTYELIGKAGAIKEKIQKFKGILQTEDLSVNPMITKDVEKRLTVLFSQIIQLIDKTETNFPGQQRDLAQRILDKINNNPEYQMIKIESLETATEELKRLIQDYDNQEKKLADSL